jgi:hypothetical protein
LILDQSVIPVGAMWDDGEEIVGLRVVSGGGAKKVFANEIDVILRSGAFEDAAEDRVAVSGVLERSSNESPSIAFERNLSFAL